MECFILILVAFLLIWLPVVCIKNIHKAFNAPKQLRDSFKALGNPKGKTYDEIVSFLGKPDSIVKNSDETSGVVWYKEGTGRTEIVCIFDDRSVCVDFEETYRIV